MLINFAQRWRRATKWREFSFLKKTMARWHDDAMLKIERISWILSPAFAVFKERTEIPEDDPELYVSKEDHPENWHVQVDISLSCKLFYRIRWITFNAHRHFSYCRSFVPLIQVQCKVFLGVLMLLRNRYRNHNLLS